MAISFSQVTFNYPGQERPALRRVSLEIPAGKICLVCGESGAGKSTLLRCLNGLVPHFSGGRLEGQVRVNGLDPVALTPQKMSRHVGFVFQDPETQFVLEHVEDEIAFALENLAVEAGEIRERIDFVLDCLNLTDLRSRSLHSLSGGEKQRVAIASALALRPAVLALDEPTSQLDPLSAEDVFQALTALNRRLQLTIVLSEHRLERVLPFTDTMVYLASEQDGAFSGAPRQVLSYVKEAPPVVMLGRALGWNPAPVSLEDAKALKSSACFPTPAIPRPDKEMASVYSAGSVVGELPALLEAQEISASYAAKEVLHNVNLKVRSGEILALMGPNGSGKTTLLRVLVGLHKDHGGAVRLSGQDLQAQPASERCRRIGYLPQDPNSLLFSETVLDEILVTLRNHKMPVDHRMIGELLDRLGLGGLQDRYPRDLSSGQRQRAALAAIAATRPQLLLLDEPTRGMDAVLKGELGRILRGWAKDGTGILLVTHDVEFAASTADRVAVIDSGYLIHQGSARDVALQGHACFSPQIVRLYPGQGWLTAQEAAFHIANQDNKTPAP